MKAISIVGGHKSGKTTLVSALVGALKGHGRVGTIKHMPGHQVDHGDTFRHIMSGADVSIGVGLLGGEYGTIRVSRGGDLEQALQELKLSGIDFAIVEGFKTGPLPKIVLGDIDVQNSIRRLSLSELDDKLIDELTGLIMGLQDIL
jgi:molybdopterin synthase catalytic subunit